MLSIFFVFLKLGCHSFGGPTAHFGYFRDEFVHRRKWLSDPEFADMVALCQFLPGPTSSQTGFAIGYRKGGVCGAFLAWIGFTLPSAALMIGFAYSLASFQELAEAGWISGLKVTAVAIVAHAAWGMASSLCPDKPRAGIAVLVLIVLVLFPNPFVQVASIAFGALAGLALAPRSASAPPTDEKPASLPENSRFGAAICLIAFAILLFGLPAMSQWTPESATLRQASSYYATGSLVFGGGHVVLPLLESATVQTGDIDTSTFLAGYGAAQALPGPLFSFAAFLGAATPAGFSGVPGGLFTLTMIYLPSWLLVLGIIPFWNNLRGKPLARACLWGANAAVVGVLLAAFYDPIWTSSILGPKSLAVAIVCFSLLHIWKVPSWVIVIVGATAGWLLNL